MASNKPNQQQHPLQPPLAGGSTASSSSGGGLGRSAPIRTVGGPPRNLAAGLPGGLATPPLVKSKLPLKSATPLNSSASSGGGAAVAHATGRVPPIILPQQQRAAQQMMQQQQQQRPSAKSSTLQSAAAAATFSQPPPITTPTTTASKQIDPIDLSRKSSGPDPVVLARQSPGAAAAVSNQVHNNTHTPDNSAQLGGAHIVALPPPTSTAFHPLDTANVGGSVQQSSAAAAVQQHQLKQPPATVPAFKSPQQSMQKQSNTQTQLQQLHQSPSSSSPTKKQPQQSLPRRTALPSTTATAEDELDTFLRGGESTTGIIRKIRPSPLPSPNQTILQKAQTLASRRAWGDVIRVTNDALLGKENGLHHVCYSELLSAAAAAADPLSSNDGELVPDSSTVAKGAELDTLRQETCQLIALRLISQLKLRRYVDLGREVGQLGLMPYLPDHPGDDGNEGTMAADSGYEIPPSPGVDASLTPIPPSPGTPGTLGTFNTADTSIDIVDANSVKQSSTKNDDAHPLAWREGSIHTPSRTKDILPTWVPFGLRILAAHQLQYNDGRAIDVLYDLRDRSVRTEYWNTAGMEIWKGIIDNALVNAFVRKKEWRLALKGLEDLLTELEHSGDREVDWWCKQGRGGDAVNDEERGQMKEVVIAAGHVELRSRQLLILLQSGAIAAGEAIQNEVRLNATKVQSLMNPQPTSMGVLSRVKNELALVRQVPVRQMINEGLLLLARCNYTGAAKFFRDALSAQRKLDPFVVSTTLLNPPGCPTWKDISAPTLGFDADPSLTVECLNNLSLCLLYSGNMRSSVNELEGLVRQDPCLYLTEGVAFNLCTLYELGSDGEDCVRKKKLLQRVAKRFYLHDVGVESFRLG